MEDLLNIIREFETFTYKRYDRKRLKHDPAESYFYLARKLAKCMMRADALSLHVYPVIT